MLLEQQIEKILDNPIDIQRQVTKEATALYHEFRGNYAQALQMWRDIHRKESLERTIRIIKKSGGSKEWIHEYGRKVFIEDPKIGMELFTSKNKE